MTKENTMPPAPEESLVDFSKWDELKTDAINGRLIKTERFALVLKEYFLRRYSKPIDVGFYDDDDVHEMTTDEHGFEVLKPELFEDFLKWNNTVASRQGCVVKDNGVLFGAHGWVCWRPQDFADRIRKRRREVEEEKARKMFGEPVRNVEDKLKGSSPFADVEQSVVRGKPPSDLTKV